MLCEATADPPYLWFKIPPPPLPTSSIKLRNIFIETLNLTNYMRMSGSCFILIKLSWLAFLNWKKLIFQITIEFEENKKY